MYYIEQNNKIVLADNNRENLENTILFTPQYEGLEIQEVPEGYTIVDFELMTIEEAEVKKQRAEREKIDMLYLTAADVERAIYKSKGIDFEDILELVKDNSDIDIKALKIELKANNFYRGNPYVEAIGNILGFSSEDLDYLFENGEFRTKDL